MKTRMAILSILSVVALPLGIGYTYDLGYARGAADERLHWLMSYKDGIWAARENPAHPILKSGSVGLRDAVVIVNSIPEKSPPK